MKTEGEIDNAGGAAGSDSWNIGDFEQGTFEEESLLPEQNQWLPGHEGTPGGPRSVEPARLHPRSHDCVADGSEGARPLPGHQATGGSIKESDCPPHPGTVTVTATSSQPIVPRACEPLVVETARNQAEWEAKTRGVAEREFSLEGQRSGGKDSGKTDTVLHTSRLLHDLLMVDGGHAALFFISDKNALREEFTGELTYTDGQHLVRSLEGKCVFDEDFPQLLSSYTRHEKGDRDEKGITRDGAFLVSSRSGKIKAASAALPDWLPSRTIRNSGTRHKALVGVVERFMKQSKPCVGFLLSEGGSLKILSAGMLQREEPVLQICREEVNPDLHKNTDSRQDVRQRAPPPLLTPEEIAAVPGLVLAENPFLGKGGFGSVFKGTINGVVPVAVKRIKEKNDRDRRGSFVTAEGREEHRTKVAKEDSTLPVLELCEGDLTKLTSRGPLCAQSAVPIFQTIANALKGLHKMGILHLDLKRENVLLKRVPGEKLKEIQVDETKVAEWTRSVCEAIRVCDFGLATLQSSDGYFVDAGRGGTPLYMAHEQWRDETPTENTDVYALGVLMWELLSGKRVWEGTGLPEDRKEKRTVLRQRVIDGQRPSLQEIPEALRPLVSCMWRENPADRPTAEECAQFLDCPLDLFLNVTAESLREETQATGKGKPLHVKALLKLGLVDVNVRWKSITLERNWTAAHEASRYGQAEMLRVLIDAGADLNAQDERGCTPAHRAAELGSVEILQILANAGADLKVRNRFNATPADVAKGFQRDVVIKAIEDLCARQKVLDGTHPSVAALGGGTFVSGDRESRRQVVSCAGADGGDGGGAGLSGGDASRCSSGEGGQSQADAPCLTREEREILSAVPGLQIPEPSFFKEGNLGPVFRATLHRQPVVVGKVVDEGDKFQEAALMVSVMRKGVSHPNVLRSFGEYFCPETGSRLLVLELCESDVTRLTDEGPVPVGTALSIIRTIADALVELHRHGDPVFAPGVLKLENVLVKGRPESLGQVETGDLCTSIRVSGFGLAESGRTSQYIAPEQWGEGGQPTENADVYALGMIFWELLSGERAWKRKDREEIRACVLNGARPSLKAVRPAVAESISRMWKQEAAERLTAAEIVEELNVLLGGSETLCDAVKRSDSSTVSKLVTFGLIDVNSRGKDGWFPLATAAAYGQDTIVPILLQAGAEKDKRHQGGWTPLCIAAWGGHNMVVRTLLEKGADKNKATNRGQTPLYLASWRGHEVVVSTLLNAGADKNKADERGWTPLYVAAFDGNFAVVQTLIAAGADMKKATNDGDTPLEAAEKSYRGDSEKVVALLTDWERRRKLSHCVLQ
uniref:Protein kinase domain-containing protein n=1 Tax=Chromera velia CCMP2878 TaxID=1169474 RepID=A0A0G4F8Z1_9ALVE|eukprot:Cvel_15832.t1-p1 / transcript=Cvel_15832.t1 / gene=Cvel_15832 / organism=Chromera_velia_CCMP2878 / gene_product=Ankyrin repeat domain-containing protein 50, putative / transcript_product=Ankyrin repeat domain-containing protein 50, putative / location=Cvel_scaffold1190:5961-16237(-) / protein_length=1319 / sequence_SO=supercontig / SO=protein_coding / is_pseudo=false